MLPPPYQDLFPPDIAIKPACQLWNPPHFSVKSITTTAFVSSWKNPILGANVGRLPV